MERIINLRKKAEARADLAAEQEKQQTAKESISWEADYSIYVSRHWQMGMVFLLIGTIALFIFLKQGFFSIAFFSFLLFVLLLKFKTRQKTIPVLLQKHNIQFGKRDIPFRELRSFWITYEPQGLKELSIQQKSWHSAYIKIPIDGQDPIQIREFLLDYVPEQKHEDSIFDILARKLGM